MEYKTKCRRVPILLAELAFKIILGNRNYGVASSKYKSNQELMLLKSDKNVKISFTVTEWWGGCK